VTCEEEPNKITINFVLKSYSDGIFDKDVEVSDKDDFAASMGDEEDDGRDILKEFLSNQSRDTFLPQNMTRKIRTENSVIIEPSKHKNKGEILNKNLYVILMYNNQNKFIFGSLE